MIPQNIHIFSYTINTFVIFGILAFFVALAVYWNEVRRDGFDEERALDLAFISLGFSLGFWFVYWYTSTFQNLVIPQFNLITFTSLNLAILVIAFIASILYFCLRWNWSFYRISDIFTVSVAAGAFVLFLGFSLILSNVNFLFLFLLYFIAFIGLKRVRLLYNSGLVFFIFLALHVFVDLKLYLLLLTIGLVNLYFREKRSTVKTSLPADFVSRIKNLLTKKEKELVAEQKLLIDEDPYMAEGRTESNEYIDDVVEDISKTENDLRLSFVRDLKIRVRKALAKIKVGSYGVCDVCGKSIDKDRLEAYPEAATCVEHAS